MDIHEFDVEYSSDLKQYGVQDDGHPFIGELFFVTITAPDGRRWVFNASYPGVKVEHDEEGLPHFMDIRPHARAQCEGLVRRIKAHGKIDLQYWKEDRPAYGSEAYIRGGWSQEEAMLERIEEAWSLRADMT